MSRNEEKARASLNRWRQLSSGTKSEGDVKVRRLASECNSIPECEATRQRLVSQIAAKVEQISHMSPDDACRKLNDEINKLIRIKGHWERQIRALGGPDYRNGEDNSTMAAYMYFGAAKELPEVKSLAKKRETDTLTSSMMPSKRNHIDPSNLSVEYFGLNESDLVAAEADAENRARQAAREKANKVIMNEAPHWSEYWITPSSVAIEEAVLNFRKQTLLRRFANA